MTRWKTVAVLAVLMTFGLGGAAWAVNTGIYFFSGTQYTDDFTDILRGAQINDDGALDLGGTGHTALNFTGSTGSAGDTWLTKWTPGGSPSVFDLTCDGTVAASADILIHGFNNKKGAGLVTFLNDANPGDKGLALIMNDAGNTDTLQLATIDPFTGKLITLANLSLKNTVKENAWYRVVMNVQLLAPDQFRAGGAVFSHTDPGNPGSLPDQLLGLLFFDGTFSGTGLQPDGQVGIVATATSASVNSSVTIWNATDNCTTPTNNE
jgi:hypothetical protein